MKKNRISTEEYKRKLTPTICRWCKKYMAKNEDGICGKCKPRNTTRWEKKEDDNSY